MLKIKDKVWLLLENIKTKRPCDKLDYRRLGPFVIKKKINLVVYRLELPATMKVYSVFHVSFFEPYRESVFFGRMQSPPPSIEIENHEEYEVEKVLDSRRNRKKFEYLVHWSGYDINERTWKHAKNLANAPKRYRGFINDILINLSRLNDSLFLKLDNLRI